MPSNSDQTKYNIAYAADIIRASQFAIALTGAGVSTPSGIPDFRTPTSGLWERYDPFEVASLDAFRQHPDKFFNWIHPLAHDIYAAQPNQAHLALARLQRSGSLKTIITQNIDGLHQRAGSDKVLEVHGSLQTMTCVSCYRQTDSGEFASAFIERHEIPRCTYCHNILKPDVVLFGEQLPARTWLKTRESISQCDLMIVAGSSLEVLPVAGLPMRAVENGAHLIIINQTETYIDPRADIVISEDVAITLPRIVQEVLGD